jgi:hypothetical protein
MLFNLKGETDMLKLALTQQLNPQDSGVLEKSGE